MTPEYTVLKVMQHDTNIQRGELKVWKAKEVIVPSSSQGSYW